MKPVELPFLSIELNRHGNQVVFVRRGGRRIRIREKLGTPEFLDAYKEALARLSPLPPTDRTPVSPTWPPGTLGWMVVKYFGSDEFLALDERSQSVRRGVIESCLDETSIAKDGRPAGFCPLHLLTSQTVKTLRDLKKDKPGAANNRRKYLSSMFGWAIEQTPPFMKSNPVRDVRRLKYESEGFHTWTVSEFDQFEKRHPPGTKAYLALALLLYTGTRRGDMVTLGRQHVKDGWLRFVPGKGRKQTKQVVLSEKPWLPVLANIVAISPCGDLTFLMTEYGKPFTAAGFGNWFRDRCDEAGMKQCSAHGLRKMGATRAAENGATEHQLMAIFDWKTPGQARIYTAKARRKRLAGGAMALLVDTSEDGDESED